MPQFDFGTFPSQIFWLVVCFAALYVLLVRTALPRIADILESRQRKIDDDLERAAELEQKAKEALAGYEAAMEDARSEAQAVVRQATEEMAAEAEKQHQAVSEKLAGDVDAAEARIAEARQEAIANIQQVANEAARAATRRLIGVEVDEGRAAEAVAAVARERS